MCSLSAFLSVADVKCVQNKKRKAFGHVLLEVHVYEWG